MPKTPLLTHSDDPLSGRGYDAPEGVEEVILSGVDRVDHNGRNSRSAAHNAVGLAGGSPVVGIDCLPT